MTQHQKPTLLVLAAGIGSRYGGLKQLDPVGPSGETIIDYSVFDALRAGFGKVVFIIRKQIEKEFLNFFDGRFKGKIETDYVFQELEILPDGHTPPEGRTKPWGTGHAVLMAREKIKEPFAVINADDYYGPGAYTAIAEFLGRPKSDTLPEYALAGYPLGNTLSEFGGVSRGICETDDHSFLKTVTETKNIHYTHNAIAYPDDNGALVFLPSDTVVSMNTWAFRPEVFDDFAKLFATFLREHGQDSRSEFYIPTVADYLIHNGYARFRVLPVNEKWFGVTYQEDRPQVVDNLKKLVAAGLYPEKLWE